MLAWRSDLDYQQRLARHWQAVAARAMADAVKWHKEAQRSQHQRNEAWEEANGLSMLLAQNDQHGVEVYTRMMERAYGQ